jgi:DNA-binding NarL/FixJ family response regulator
MRGVAGLLLEPKHSDMGQTAKNSRPRVLVADDHTMFAETLRDFLSTEYEVVGVVGDGTTLLHAAKELQPEVVVVDAALMLPGGVNASCRLKQQFPLIRLVCVTQQREPTMAVEAFRKGASAFLVKDSPATELLTAIREALMDHIYISPLIANKVVCDLLDASKRKDGDAHLTARQREVLRLLAQGKSMKSIAVTLGISARTVQFHKYEMMKNLRFKSNAEIVQYAIYHGIIPS